MWKSILATGLFLAAANASASDLAMNESCLSEALVGSSVYQAIELDINGDTKTDLACVVNGPASDEYFQLFIYLGKGDGSYELAALAENLLMEITGGMVSVGEPVLSSKPFAIGASLIITLEHFGVGRYKWAQTLTLAYRGNDVRLAGVDHNAYDSLDPEANPESCSFNMLRGNMTYVDANGENQTGAVDSGMVYRPVESVSDEEIWEMIGNDCQG